jgi:energy-coupling factor transporter ATP-binding protein EcfA2
MFDSKKRIAANDMFTGRREQVIMRSKVREVFTPSRPVQMIELLLGRETNIGRLIEILNTPGQHALLFGDRGVGKSSLANIAGAIIRMHNYFDAAHITVKACGSEDTFDSIVRGALIKVGIDPSVFESGKTHKQKGAAKITAFFATADVESAHETNEKKRHSLNASFVAEALQKTKGLLVIDEADAIEGEADKKKIAELIKLLSDANSPFKILVVGIAETGMQLVAGHKSVERCLGEVKLKRLAAPELWQIIATGQKKVGAGRSFEFDHDVINSIVGISNGYPYFTHLLALKCAEEAIVAGRFSVRKEHLREATIIAAEAAEGVLRNTYESATRSASVNGKLYKSILLAAAKMANHEFNAKDLRDEICRSTGETVSQSRLSNFYSSLISDTSETILRRVGKGVYCFNDPRMASFIRIVNSDV